MLSLFNRFLNRMRASHPILGNRNLLILILDFLEGEDLFQIIQVCFSFRTTVHSVPSLEISLLRFTMKKSNNCIEKLRSLPYQTQANPKFPSRTLNLMPFIALKKKQEDKPIKGNSKKADMPDFNEEKWVEFKKYFYQYAKRKGFNILKRKDFQNERE